MAALQWQPLARDGSPPPVTVYAVATAYKLGLHNLVASLRHHGFAYEVLEFGSQWRGWRGRMTAYRDAARTHAQRHGPTSLCAFIDAYDALCIRSGPDALLAAYEGVSGGKPMVVGLEAGCKDFPGITSNCGFAEQYWMATRGAVPRGPTST
jgi:hypothetical protein